jgi:alkyl sulfatase BDS1-like metallo-beta-lactamase superfamily hydrolase
MRKKNFLLLATVILSSSVLLSACSDSVKLEKGSDKQGHTEPSSATIALNKGVIETLNFDDTKDFDDAKRGLIAQEESLIVRGKTGETVWDMDKYQFSQDSEEVPGSVHPSLWRQAQLNNIHGLFKVAEGVYQLRGYDLANMTIIEGDTGWILVDPLTSAETANHALRFAQKHLGKQPIRAILYTHSHIDHFGGVQGVLSTLSREEKKNLRIIAPEGFMEEATSENIIAGTAMSRRAMFMYGKRLSRSERGHVGSGLGKGPAFGTFGLMRPNELVNETGTELDIDGVPFVFQYTPNSEAPAEFTFYLPEQKAFCGAEVVSRNLHNLYTLRGAKVRDALAWSGYIDEAMGLFSESEVYFGSHHWPLWGKENIKDFLAKQRDTYKYIHDQSVRLMNGGLTPNEIADQIKLPDSLAQNFPTRGYYGTVKHNAKAIYQSYMGWFTANPAMLDPLPEQESAVRTVEMMGGAEAVLRKAHEAYQNITASTDDINREYRWLAQLLNQVVFSDPSNLEAKQLLAKVYDQLAYQAESAPWRDFYLTGAYELRHGTPDKGISPATMKHVLIHASVEKFFDSMAVGLNGEDAEGVELNVEIHFSDLRKRYLLSVENSVLSHREIHDQTDSDASLSLTHSMFIDILVGDAGAKDILTSDDVNVEGSLISLITFFSLIEKQEGVFNIVTP